MATVLANGSMLLTSNTLLPQLSEHCGTVFMVSLLSNETTIYTV